MRKRDTQQDPWLQSLNEHFCWFECMSGLKMPCMQFGSPPKKVISHMPQGPVRVTDQTDQIF